MPVSSGYGAWPAEFGVGVKEERLNNKKCAICIQKNCFSCEHQTPVKNSIFQHEPYLSPRESFTIADRKGTVANYIKSNINESNTIQSPNENNSSNNLKKLNNKNQNENQRANKNLNSQKNIVQTNREINKTTTNNTLNDSNMLKNREVKSDKNVQMSQPKEKNKTNLNNEQYVYGEQEIRSDCTIS